MALRFRAYDGTTQSLAARRGKPVVVAVVATWAGPALVEVERLKALRSARDDDFELILIVLDEAVEMAAIFAETFGVPESVGRVEDVPRFVSERGPFGPIGVVPTSVLLDAEGRIAVRSDGPWPEGTLSRALDALGRPDS
ncbi:MAG: hypothetical protein AAFZ18_30240 [Myxococcota bacterium]